MKVSGIYTRQVLDAGPEEGLAEVAARMRENDVSSLAVLGDDQLVGIITERDLVQAVADSNSSRLGTVAEYMSASPVTADPDDDIDVVATRMIDHGVRHLPVVRDGAVVGMISARDLVALEASPGGDPG